MITTTTYSRKIKNDLIIVMTFDYLHFITNNGFIVIARPEGFHMNSDGLSRAIDLFEDPRFDYWVNEEKSLKKVTEFHHVSLKNCIFVM